MPRFFFNICDGDQKLCDPEGSELATLDVAYDEAILDARWLLAEELRIGIVSIQRKFEITNEAGQILATVCFQDALNGPTPTATGLPSKNTKQKEGRPWWERPEF